MEHTTHRVALVVMCEAEGSDAYDAAVGARMALSNLIYGHKVEDSAEAVALVPTSLPPRCAACGSTPPLTSKGKVWAHVSCETWPPKKGQTRCPGSGKPPHEPREPVIGYVRRDGLPIYARVYEVMDAGVAAGNGYLWLQPTIKAYRGM